MISRRYKQWVAALSVSPAEERRRRSEARLRDDPRCPIARYVLACADFDSGRPASAVRSMMIAHHSDPALQSAALLVFAGLNWIEKRNRPLLDVLVATWEEFRRPQFDRTPREKLLLDAFAEPAEGLQGVSPLARGLWRLPLRAVREQLRDVAARHDAVEYPLLLATA
jgi:hypothetical protein